MMESDKQTNTPFHKETIQMSNIIARFKAIFEAKANAAADNIEDILNFVKRRFEAKFRQKSRTLTSE